MRISVLGPLIVGDVSTPPSPRDRVVLEALTLRRGEVVNPDQLADVLWPDAAPSSWNKVIQGCVSRLRRSLGPTAIETTSDGYRLVAASEQVDSIEFERLVRRGRELLALGEPERADRATREALALWRGQPFGDLGDWDDARIERERLTELRLDAEELALDAALRSGRHREVLAEAHARAEQQPIREMRWALLARAQYQAGRQTEALRTLRRARELLATEVGLEPGRELATLENSMLQQDPALDVQVADATASRACPFPGLLPYDVDQSDLFFGRTNVVAECIRLIEQHDVVAVAGPSGSGKSSVLRAGVAAHFIRSGRAVRIVSPGPRPSDTALEIDQCTADVLVVDQLEEAASVGDHAGAEIFFDAVVRFSDRARVAVAVRTDQLGVLTEHRPLARLLERSMYLLGPMSESELRSAIERPALESGLLLEPGLADLLVREVEWDPGALPLMGHAIQRTWERREGRVLTVSGYRETGGLRGAVAQTAESLYVELSSSEQTTVRDVVMRMVVPDRDGAPMRCAVPRRMFGGEAHERIIDRLVDSRLVTSDDGSVELAHEALARAWPRLQTWLDDDVEGQRIFRHLTMTADSWVALGRPESELYRGVRLRTAVDWRNRADPGLASIEHDFLEASERDHRRAEAESEARANEQARRNRQLRALLLSATVLLFVAVLASLLAWRSAGRANDVAAMSKRARANTLADLSRNVIDDDRGLALLLAVEAYRLDGSASTRGAMLDASFERPFTRTSIATPAAAYMALSVDNEGTVAVAKRPDGQLDVIDLATRAVRHAGLPSPASPVDGLDVHPDGSIVASSGGGSVTVYDLESGSEVAEVRTNTEFTFTRFSPSGGELVISDENGTLVLVDTVAWREVATIDTGTGDVVSALGFGHPADDSANTLFLTTVRLDGQFAPAQLHAFDVDSGARVAGPVETAENLVSSIVASADGHLALVGRQIERRTTADLALIGEPFGFTEVDGLVTLGVLEDGRLLAGSPIELQVFAAAEPGGRPAPALVLERGAAGVAVVPATGNLVTADIDGTVSTWTITPDGLPGMPLGDGGAGQVTASPDGATLAIWDDDVGVRLRDGATLMHRTTLGVERDLDVLGLDLDDDRVVTLTCSQRAEPCTGIIDTWDAMSGEHLAGPRTAGELWGGLRKGVAFADAGTLVAVGDAAGVVNTWDADTLDPVGDGLDMTTQTAVLGEQVWAVAATNVDGSALLASHDQLGQSVVWDVTDRSSPVVVGTLENAFRMDFLADGTLVTASGPGSLTLRDPLTLEPISAEMRTAMPADTYSSSDDGLMIASGDLGAQVWNILTGEMLTGPMPAARSTITADGSTLHLGAGPPGSELGTEARSVVLLGDDLVREACRRAGRNLTHDEWNSLIGSDLPYRPTCHQWPSDERTEER